MAATCINLDVILSEISQSQKTNTVWFHLGEYLKIVKCMETKSRTGVTKKKGQEGMWSNVSGRQF